MCGIAGFLDTTSDKEKDAALLEKMLGEIEHRGPDSFGIHVDGGAAIGMRRLSIIDLAGGDQPIYSEDGQMAIVFNGEIYNYKKLRENLEKDGHTFSTDSDTEVVLRLYEIKREKVLEDLRGMFVFAIFDKTKNEIFLARDFFGIKPLYYEVGNNGSIKAFASEIKSIFAKTGKKYELNTDAVYNYLRYQYNPYNETMFKGIFKLAPGHFMRVDAGTGKYEIEKYWEFGFAQDDEMAENKGVSELRDLLADSVAHHMVADVPVGSFLSGGVDSAVIAGLARKHKPGDDLLTFTIGSQDVNEFNAAREMSDKIQSMHTEVMLKPDRYFDELPKIARHFDEPVADPSAVALYFLAEAASKKVKVVMSGEGSDELFGGYNIYREPFAVNRLRDLPPFITRPLFALVKILPFSFWGINYLKRAAQSLEERYIGNAQVYTATELKKTWKGSKTAPFSLQEDYERVKNESDSTKMQYIDIKRWLVGDILAKADKMTMAHSLELRVPFLDKEVARFASRLPDVLKYKNGTTKYLFRKAAEGLLPKSTQKRKKLGFPVALSSWLREDNSWQETIRKSPIIQRFVDEKHVDKLIAEHINGRNNSRKIFILLMLATWYDVFSGNLIFEN